MRSEPEKNSTFTTATSSLAPAVKEIASDVRKVAPSAGLVRLTVGGSFGVFTALVIDGEIDVAPEPSVALAVMECVPAESEAVIEYGADVSSPIRLEPEKNSTLLTETSSVASAVNAIASVVRNVAPLAGKVTVTVGG